MYVTRVYGRTTFGTFGRVRKRVCTQSTGYTRVTYAHIGYTPRMCVRVTPDFQIVHPFGFICIIMELLTANTRCALFYARSKESAKILSRKKPCLPYDIT